MCGHPFFVVPITLDFGTKRARGHVGGPVPSSELLAIYRTYRPLSDHPVSAIARDELSAGERQAIQSLFDDSHEARQSLNQS
jgi:hypothetical protein